MKELILFSVALFLVSSQETIFAKTDFNYEKDTKNITAIRVYKTYYIGNSSEDFDTLRFPNDVNVGNLELGRLEIAGTWMSLFVGSGTPEFGFDIKRIYKIRFSEDRKILGIKTKGPTFGGPSAKPSEVIRTEMFYCTEGFPQQEITKFLEGKLGK
jgi:hypothetical protein